MDDASRSGEDHGLMQRSASGPSKTTYLTGCGGAGFGICSRRTLTSKWFHLTRELHRYLVRTSLSSSPFPTGVSGIIL